MNAFISTTSFFTVLLASAPTDLLPAVLILLIWVSTVTWVYTDAKHQRDNGEPVVLTIGSIQIDTPEAWLLACLVLWLIAVPMYVIGRRQ